MLLSFGSYVAVPPALSAYILGIPIITHEQTTVPGIANKIVAKMARAIAITFPESKNDFPKGKTLLTGNPIRPAFFENKRRVKNNIPKILITGGSRGSQKINNAVLPALPELLEIAVVSHQTGITDFIRVKNARQELPEKLQKNYEISANYSPQDFEAKLKNAVKNALFS